MFSKEDLTEEEKKEHSFNFVENIVGSLFLISVIIGLFLFMWLVQ